MAEKEYIERGAAVERIRLIYCKDCNNYNGVRCRACDFDNAMLLIEDVPAADVAPVVHGEWRWEGKFKACSMCGTYVEWAETLGSSFWNYCPYCGAKMDGGKANE